MHLMTSYLSTIVTDSTQTLPKCSMRSSCYVKSQTVDLLRKAILKAFLYFLRLVGVVFGLSLSIFSRWKQQRCDIRGVPFFSIFLGMKNRWSMDPVQRGGPWTWGPGFVLSHSQSQPAVQNNHFAVYSHRIHRYRARHIPCLVQSCKTSTKYPRNARDNFIHLVLKITRNELPVE